MLPPSPLERSSTIPEGTRCATHAERPALAVCARCRAAACASCTRVLASGDSICVRCEEGEVASFPWERRAELGIGRALTSTIAGALRRPAAFFALRSRERALWPTLMLGMALHVWGALSQLAVNLAFGDRMRAELARDPAAQKMLGWFVSDEFFVMNAVLSPVAFLVGTYLLAAAWWISLRAVGAPRRPFHLIVRALCYAQAVAVLVPLIAPLALTPIGMVFGIAFESWALSIQIIAITRMQGATIGRGVAAFFLVLAIAGCVGCLVLSSSFWALASQIRVPNV